ncbi:MAG: DUF881 domain-containing protein [Actinomycetota bacterium]|nr:DUF881 domain-containing protein [Actinomycetota bacterium]
MNGTEPAAGSVEEPGPVSDHRALARRTIANRAAVAVLCAVLGFAGVIQVRRTAAGDTLSSARPDDLVQILDGLQRREDDLNTEIATLQETLTRLQGRGASSAEALAEANRQAEALGILTGTVPTEGAGVRIVISDPERRVPPELLLDALEELRNAGAEAYQIGPVRVGVQSSFSGAGGAITLDGVALAAPYTVLAIGDPPTLAAAMAIPGGVVDTVRRAAGSMTTTAVQRVSIHALRPARAPLYARPAGG